MKTNDREPLARQHRSAIGATMLGISLAEYQARIDAGLRRCYDCKGWHPLGEMSVRSSRPAGIDNICKRRANERAKISVARSRARRRQP